MEKFLPVCEPCFSDIESKYVLEAVQSAWVSSAGQFLEKFETGFASYCGMKHGVSTTSGTTALHLALVACDIQVGDEVIIPDFSMAAVLSSVLYCGATPVFIDAEKDTWNISVSAIEEKITEKTRVILPVHTYGHPVDMSVIWEIARKKRIIIIEDAAEAHGAEYKGQKCGSLGELSCFSFFGNKIITTGEGGMVLTNSDDIAQKLRYYKNLCFPYGKREYRHDDLGFNYRMTNMQAALGLAQLEKIDYLAQQRINNAQEYCRLLSDIEGIRLPVNKPYAKNVYWMFGIVLDPNKAACTRDELSDYLTKNGIDNRSFFRPLHSQKMLNKFGIRDVGYYPVTEYLAQNGLYLPSSSKLTKDEIARVCEAVIRGVVYGVR